MAGDSVTLRPWQRGLVDLLESADCPPVVVVNKPAGAGKSWLISTLEANVLPDRAAVDTPDTAVILVDGVSEGTAGEAMQLLRSLVDTQPVLGLHDTDGTPVRVVLFGRETQPLVQRFVEFPGLRWALIDDFERLDSRISYLEFANASRDADLGIELCPVCDWPARAGAVHVCSGPQWGAP